MVGWGGLRKSSKFPVILPLSFSSPEEENALGFSPRTTYLDGSV